MARSAGLIVLLASFVLLAPVAAAQASTTYFGQGRPLRWRYVKAWRSTAGSAYVGDFVGTHGAKRVEFFAILAATIAAGASPAASARLLGQRPSQIPQDREMQTLLYRSCVASEPALAMVADLHRVSFRTACRITRKIASHPWPESDRIKITRWCWNDLGRVRSFDGWNVKVRGFQGPATLSRHGRWFAFMGQEFPISCV
jgi:hypothetical protein